MRKELKATTEGVHAYIDRLMELMDAHIRTKGGGMRPTDAVVARCMEEIRACNELLIGQDVVQVVTSDHDAKIRALRPAHKCE
jgi:hypothetical protein